MAVRKFKYRQDLTANETIILRSFLSLSQSLTELQAAVLHGAKGDNKALFARLETSLNKHDEFRRELDALLYDAEASDLPLFSEPPVKRETENDDRRQLERCRSQPSDQRTRTGCERARERAS